jgi:hypothetical protein
MKSKTPSNSLKLVPRFSRTSFQLTSLAFLLSAQPAFCQLATGWKQHDMKRQLPAVVEPGQSNLPLAPPSDAIVLFDGSSLDAWQGPEGKELNWIIRDGAMEIEEHHRHAGGGEQAQRGQNVWDCPLHHLYLAQGRAGEKGARDKPKGLGHDAP